MNYFILDKEKRLDYMMHREDGFVNVLKILKNPNGKILKKKKQTKGYNYRN